MRGESTCATQHPQAWARRLTGETSPFILLAGLLGGTTLLPAHSFKALPSLLLEGSQDGFVSSSKATLRISRTKDGKVPFWLLTAVTMTNRFPFQASLQGNHNS